MDVVAPSPVESPAEPDEHDDDQFKDEDPSDELSSPVATQQTSNFPLQKRRRVTRACDECRRKKIKCDGTQPCTHCTVYSYDCTYDQPSHRRRNPGPRYVESLERRLQRAEAILQSIAPGIDLNDPSFYPTLPITTDSNTPQRSASSKQPSDDSVKAVRPDLGPSTDSGLESMVKATGQLDLDDRGHWNYYGHSSGLNFLRRIRDQFGNVVDPEQHAMRSTPFARRRSLGQDFSSPKSPSEDMDSPFGSVMGEPGDLPPRVLAQKWCSNSLDHGSAILNLVHKPSFWKSFDRVFSLEPEHYEKQDHRFLPLLYTTLAMGCLFANHEEGDVNSGNYDSVTDIGYKYIGMAKQLMDVTDCRDITSLQAIIFMILFLQCSAKLSTCYSYIGIALRAALRMGLHRSFRDSFTPIEAETRKRAFWVIRKMDVYCGAMLGLPLTLSDDDFDQDFPTEVDDEYITETEILPMPSGSVPCAAAANANFRLGKILTKIIKNIYPIKGFQNREQNPSRTYSVSFATICKLENDLKTWEEDLPPELKPGGARQPSHVGPMQQLLRMAYAHAQMMLYRPFLHYVSSRGQPLTVDKRSYGCAAACVSVSRNIIHITSEMVKEGLLIGSYWFTMYTAFFAILSLLYYAVENPETVTAQEVMRDAREGREILAKLAKTNMAADRCTKTLSTVFESIQATLDKGANKAAQSASKKRVAPQPAAMSYMHEPRIAQSQPNLQHPVSTEVPQRARTCPLGVRQTALPEAHGHRSAKAATSQPSSGKSSHPSSVPTSTSTSGSGTSSNSKFYVPTLSGTSESAASSSSTLETLTANSSRSYGRQSKQSQKQQQQQQQQQQRAQPKKQQSKQHSQQQAQPQPQPQPQQQEQQRPQRPQPQPHQSSEADDQQQQQRQQEQHQQRWQQQQIQEQEQQEQFQLHQLHQLQHAQPSSLLQQQQTQQAYMLNIQRDLHNPGTLPDFSAMMFPSADPFAYPNQPMTTLGQSYGYNPYNPSPAGMSGLQDESNFIPASTAASGTVSADEHIDVQLFGPLPPYLMQYASSGVYPQSGQHPMEMDLSQGQTPGASGVPQGWPEQVRAYGLENLHYDDVFGNQEDWRGTFP